MKLSPREFQEIEDEDAAENIRTIQENIAQLKIKIAAEQDADTLLAWKDQLEQFQNDLNTFQMNRLLVDRQSYDRYAQRMRNAVVLDEQWSQQTSMIALMRKLLDDSITVQAFCDGLQHIVRMSEAENQ